MQFDRLKRRELMSLVGSALAWPIAGRARQAEKVFRVGLVLNCPGSEMVGISDFPLKPNVTKFLRWGG